MTQPKNNMTLLACMYLAGLVKPTLIPSTGNGENKILNLNPTPVPMSKLSLETQAIKIAAAEEKRKNKAIKRLAQLRA